MSIGGEPGRKQQTSRRTVRKTGRTAKAPQRGLSPSPSRRKDRVREAALFVISPDGQMDEAALYSAFAILRSQAPVYWVECPGMRPFWLVSDTPMSWPSNRAGPFVAAPRSVLSSEAGRPAYGRSPESRTCCVVSFKWTSLRASCLPRDRAILVFQARSGKPRGAGHGPGASICQPHAQERQGLRFCARGRRTVPPAAHDAHPRSSRGG